MNPYFIGITSGLVVALLVIVCYSLYASTDHRFKLFKLVSGKSPHEITFDCAGQPLNVIVPLIHEQGVWFGEQGITVQVKLDWPSTIIYNMIREEDVALFRLRWGGSNKYSFK